MSLQLFHSPTSPYVRKVLIVAIETGTALDLLPASANPVDRSAELVAVNPLGKVPCLRLPDGRTLYDSAVICRYIAAGSAIYPAGAQEFTALRREALADGLLDAALLTRYETVMRPDNLRWQGWIDGQMAKIHAALSAMAEDDANADQPDIGDIATACALLYLDFRYVDLDWRSDYPQLDEFAEKMARRPSFSVTAPPAA